QYFVGKHDFKAFQSSSQNNKKYKTVKTVSALTVAKQDDFIHITITADGFLYKMVRNIVGTLIAVGNGRLPAYQIPGLFKTKDRMHLPKTAPSHGLYLIKVEY